MDSPVAPFRPVSTGESESNLSAVTWSAVFAGALAAAAISFVLLLLGSAFGLTAASPRPGAGASAGTIGKGAAIWLIVVQWIAAGLGGYLTGRLRMKWVSLHTHEVFFRDTAHGFMAWALSTLVAVTLVTAAAATVAAGAADAGSRIASGAAQGITVASAQPRGAQPDGSAYFVDMLFRSNQPQAQINPAQSRSEASRILVRGLTDGNLSAGDKTYLSQVIGRETGITEAEASQRIDEVVAQEKVAEAKVRQAADQARKTAATLSFFTVLSLLIGAFIASAAAAVGGRERDEREAAYGSR